MQRGMEALARNGGSRPPHLAAPLQRASRMLWAAVLALLAASLPSCGAHYDIFYPSQLQAAAAERAIDNQVILYTFSNELTGYRDMWVHSACPAEAP